jgi:anti-sigma regulatory factor (Ser/Thr protein kinase)
LPFPGSLGSLRRAVIEDSCLEALAPHRRADVVLAVTEAATNAVKHGDTDCTLRIWSEGDAVISEVSSASVIDDPLAGRRRPRPEAVSGRGLWLINQLCDLVELRCGECRTSVRMHVRAAA